MTTDPRDLLVRALQQTRDVISGVRPEFRGPSTGFGEEQPAPPGAPAHDRLAAFAGRQLA